jgi:hypothetical protein
MGIFVFFQGFIKSGKNIFGCHLAVKEAAVFLPLLSLQLQFQVG